MAKNPVGWFEIPVTDMERGMKFYQNILGVQLKPFVMGSLNMAWFPMVQGAEGSSGALIKGEHYVPSYAGTMVYLSVDDIDATLKRVQENGGKVLNPKTSIGEYGFVAHFEDCEGNRVALHSVA